MSKYTTTAAPITDDERRKRQEAVNYARASVGLEGFKPSEAEEQRAARFVAGEIDLADFVKPAR
ncbi:antitoxin VbhA family protein (plasmid) [Acidovorax sp. GBBC 1281]|uniref:antitoxin VbhA family protein n=1 Tax=Acidovorax sp. GBBC 1281 TaxID=2940492 RepID=UPI00234B6451|nr:antitoxin VbhA family protein [Acidovorax sp. GBBC 1281]WCN00553.1 antitoxin VbhA family protein [Acidovorax sp. GBBC 1281]BDH38315.1 antitoxin VbhA family protein [Acidovorax sp. SUPP2522]